MSDNAPAGVLPPSKDPDRFKVGTLTYTKFGLIALLAWLLWGDVCMRIHSRAVLSVLNLAFKRHNAPNWLMGLLLTSMPALLNFTLNPIISTSSDRTRTRWGRRIPYLAITAPITGAMMILLGYSEDLGFGLAKMAQWSPEGTIVGMIALTYGSFVVTDLFVGSVFWCLFNDVVPKPFLARFTSAFGVVSFLTISAFNWWVFPFAETNMKEICVFAGLIYMFGYTLICFFIKEGKYPPPPAGMERRGNVFATTWNTGKVYVKECFSHRIYVLFFVSNAAFALVGSCSAFKIFFVRDSLGLTLDQQGKISSIAGIAVAVLLYPAGVLADRFHPLRYMTFTVVLYVIWELLSLTWLCWNPNPSEALTIFIIISVIGLPLGTMHEAAAFPMYVLILPRERFGQFCAANAMVISIVIMAGGVVAGLFLDVMIWLYRDVFAGHFLNQCQWFYDNSSFGYRFIPVWQWFFGIIAAATLFLLFFEWKRLGGVHNFKPPTIGDSDQAEALKEERIVEGAVEVE